jgi:hypothetical protein
MGEKDGHGMLRQEVNKLLGQLLLAEPITDTVKT